MAHSPEKATTTLRDVRARPLAKLWMAGKKWRKPPGSSKFAAEGEIGAAEATLGSTIPRRVAVKFLSRHCQNAAGSLLTDGKIQQTPPGILSISNSNLRLHIAGCNRALGVVHGIIDGETPVLRQSLEQTPKATA